MTETTAANVERTETVKETSKTHEKDVRDAGKKPGFFARAKIVVDENPIKTGILIGVAGTVLTVGVWEGVRYMARNKFALPGIVKYPAPMLSSSDNVVPMKRLG